MGYVALVVDEASREKVLAAFPPKHGNVIAHHVTLCFGVSEASFLEVSEHFSNATEAEVHGYADREGVDCLVVTVAGLENQLGAEALLHLTLSVAPGVRPVMARYAAKKVTDRRCFRMKLTGSIQFVS